MSMTSEVVGFRPSDEKWQKMKAIYKQCVAEGIEPPAAVDRFFNGEDPGDRPGMTVDISPAVTEYGADMQDGFDVDVRPVRLRRGDQSD